MFSFFFHYLKLDVCFFISQKIFLHCSLIKVSQVTNRKLFLLWLMQVEMIVTGVFKFSWITTEITRGLYTETSLILISSRLDSTSMYLCRLLFFIIIILLLLFLLSFRSIQLKLRLWAWNPFCLPIKLSHLRDFI